MSAKMPANGIRTHAAPTRDVSWYQGCGNSWTQESFRPISHRSLPVAATSISRYVSVGAGMGSNPTRNRFLLIYVEADLSL